MTDGVMAGSEVVYLVPEGTTVEGPGETAPLELRERAGKVLTLILRIAEAVEQESLHVSIWGSADGRNWGRQPLFSFPQKFYSGVTPSVLNLTGVPDTKYLQARWEVNRWGRGIPRPRFAFAVEVQDSGS